MGSYSRFFAPQDMRRYDIHATIHLPHWEQERLTPFFFSVALRTFAISMVGIYIPLYIYGLAKDHLTFLTFEEILLIIILYHILLRLTELVSNFPVARVLTRIGFKTSILLGNAILLVKIIFLLLAKYSILYFIPASIAGGLLIPFYWIPYHFIFAEEGSLKRFGAEISFLGVIKRSVSVVAPLFGGLILSLFGFNLLYVLVFTLIILSSIPIFSIIFHEDHDLGDFKDLLVRFSSKEFLPNLVSFAGIGAEAQIQQVFWPLFVFILVGSFNILGIVTSLALLFSLVMLYFVGYWVDRKDKKKTLRFGSFSNSIVWVLRLSATTVPRIFAADFLYKSMRSFLWIPFDVLFYTKARGRKTLQFLVLREWAINGGRLLSLVLVGIMIILGINWMAAFILAAFFSVLTIFMGRGVK